MPSLMNVVYASGDSVGMDGGVKMLYTTAETKCCWIRENDNNYAVC